MRGVPKPTIPWKDCLREVCFSWDDPDDGSHLTFATDRLNTYLESTKHDVDWLAVDREFAAGMPELRGLEQHRLIPLLENPKTWGPVTLCLMPDGTGLTIDGNHRYYCAYALGMEILKVWLVPMEIWGRFLIDMAGLEMPASQIEWSGL